MSERAMDRQRLDGRGQVARFAALAALGSLVALLLVVPATSRAEENPDESPEPADRRAVVKDLADEARQALEADKPYPRQEADYAQQEGLTLTQDELFRALSRSQDRHPAVDAYIRWQLTSFPLEGDELTARQWMRLVESMPAFVPAGGMDRRTRAVIERGWTGEGRAPMRVIERLQGVIDQWQAGEDRIYEINEPNERYREVLIEQLPTEGGVKLFGMLKDIEQRIAGGNKSVDTKIKHLVEEAEPLARDPDLSLSARRALIRRAAQVSAVTNKRVVSAKLKMSGETKINTQNLSFTGKKYEAFIKAMKGDVSDRD